VTFVTKKTAAAARRRRGGPVGLDDREAALARALLRAMEGSKLSSKEAGTALRSGKLPADTQRNLDKAAWEFGKEPLVWGWSVGMASGSEQMPERVAKAAPEELIRLLGGIGRQSPLVVARAQKQMMGVSKLLGKTTQKGVATVTRRMMKGEYTFSQARDVLVRNVHLGLDDRYLNAVLNRKLSLEKSLARQHPGWSTSTVEARARAESERYAKALRLSRAERVARTEVMRAVNGGRQELWEQAAKEGELPNRAKKVWLAYGPKDRCADYENTSVGVLDDFPEGNPPLHPSCRCEIMLVT
jgi:hypothetical protein